MSWTTFLMKIHRQKAALLSLLFLGWSSILFANNQALEAPLIELQDIGVASVSIQGAKVAISLEVSNPNDVDIVVESIQYQVKLNGANIKQGAIEQEVSFPALKRRNIIIKVSVTYDTELPRILSALNNPNSSIYEINGSVTIKGEETPFPFFHKDNLMIPGEKASINQVYSG